MTIAQLYLFIGIYLIVSVVVAVLTRATARRIVGALAGATVMGVVALGLIALFERLGWWHMALLWTPYFLTLMIVGCTVCAFVFLLTWRIARRFGGRGLAAFLGTLTFIGPARDYTYMKLFPEWGGYGPGFAPIVAISASYVILMLVGHSVMRLVAGPARADPLARRPWESS